MRQATYVLLLGLMVASCGPQASISLSADATTAFPGALVRLQADVEGVPESSLQWEASAGLVQVDGTSASYRAPSRIGEHTITVRSSVDSSLSASLMVTVQDRPDFAPSDGILVVEAEPDEAVSIAPDGDGGVSFASRGLNAELELVFETSAGSPVIDPVVVFSERSNGASALLAFDPSGDYAPILIVGDQATFVSILEGGGLGGAEIGRRPVIVGSFLVISGLITFGSIMWTAVKTEQSGQQIEAFFETDVVDCEFDTCLCKTPNEISVLHAARAQQLFAIPRVVLSGLLVGAVTDTVEAVALVLDTSDLLDNFGVSAFGDVKMNPFSWAEDWVAEGLDQELLSDVTTDSHLLYVVETYEDPDTGRVFETVAVIEQDCDPGVSTSQSSQSLVISGESLDGGQVSFSAGVPGAGEGVAVYFAFRNGATDDVIARRVFTDASGIAEVTGGLFQDFGSGFGLGDATASMVTVAVPAIDAVEEAALATLVPQGELPPAALFDDFDDRDYTDGPVWTLVVAGNKDDNPALNYVDVSNQYARFVSTNHGGRGGSVGLTIDVDIPVDAQTVVRFDALATFRDVGSGCGWTCREYPANVLLHLEDELGTLYRVIYGVNYGGAVQDQTGADWRIITTSVDRGVWARGLTFRVQDGWPDAARITMVQIHGSGWNFDGGIDNIAILD